MTERTYGYKYSEADNMSLVQIAKLIRADIKQAIAEGLLPKATYSVCTDIYAGGGSINVEARGIEGAWIPQDDSKCAINSSCPKPSHWKQCEAAEHLSDDASVALMTLERIHSAYNHDGSDSMTDYFDVRYYGTVTIESTWSEQYRMSRKVKA